MTDRPLVLGLGSPHGDDQAGWLVIQHLHERGVSTDNAVALPSPADIWQRCTAGQALVICDACVDVGEIGTMRRWTWPEIAFAQHSWGTHDLSLHEVLSLGQTLDLCPDQVIVWTITGVQFGPLDPVSLPVNASAGQLAETLYEEYFRA